jgi:putative transposase
MGAERGRLRLVENQVIRLSEDETVRNLRVLSCRPGTEDVVLFDIGDGMAFPEWVLRERLQALFDKGALEPLADDPGAATLRSNSDLSEYERKIRDTRHLMLAPLVEDPERLILDPAWRGRLIARRADEMQTGRNKVLSALRLWWRFGQLPNALVPPLGKSLGVQRAPGEAKRGRPRDGDGERGVNIDSDAAENLADGARFLTKGRSRQEAYHDTIRLHFSRWVTVDGRPQSVEFELNERPTFQQFNYWVGKAIRPDEIVRKVKGEAKFARQNRERFGTNRDQAAGPGGVYQIDATIANIYLRSRLNGDKMIGRPVLYIIIDVYSRLIIGFHVGLSGPSWEVGKMALENAFTEKVSFCAKYGVIITEEEWPHGVPDVLTGDRGWDVLGKDAGEAMIGMGSSIKNLPPYRPDLKGLVEGRFELLDANVKWLPGASHGRDRGDEKHPLDALYTLESFTKLMIGFIRHYNRSFAVNDPPANYAVVNGHIPSPIELWNYGKIFNVPKEIGRARVRSNLLHVTKGKESTNGLIVNRLTYMPENDALKHMFYRLGGRAWRTHTVRWDPRDVATVYLPVNRGEHFEKFILADPKYAGWTNDEVQHDLKLKPEMKRLADDRTLRSGSELLADVTEITAQARAAIAEFPKLPKSARSDRAERQAEARETRREDAWTSDPGTGQAAAEATVPPSLVPAPAPVAAPPVAATPSAAVRTDNIAALRAARAEAQRRAAGGGS